jgi:hypothetical protein
MATFFVGQRVRILWSDGWPELGGQVGRIVACGIQVTVGPSVGKMGFHVAPDCWGSHVAPRKAPHGGAMFAPLADQIEPIQPSGHCASDFSYQELMDKCREGQGVPA